MSPYEKIINLPHHVSDRRPQMPMSDRAAQFSPFAALTGYEDAVEETARFTDEKLELDESARDLLDIKQSLLMDAVAMQPEITVTYFKKDDRKAGGRYLTVTGNLKKIDEYQRNLVLMNSLRIPFDDITDIQSELFRENVDMDD